jgi:hypothetical protein
MCSSMSVIPISALQKQRDRRSTVWVGSLQPASHIAYFQAVLARGAGDIPRNQQRSAARGTPAKRPRRQSVPPRSSPLCRMSARRVRYRGRSRSARTTDRCGADCLTAGRSCPRARRRRKSTKLLRGSWDRVGGSRRACRISNRRGARLANYQIRRGSKRRQTTAESGVGGSVAHLSER